jgi:hypothetical protein
MADDTRGNQNNKEGDKRVTENNTINNDNENKGKREDVKEHKEYSNE